ncbi:hypothetical protein HYU12_01620 [Candidatus Woesearchaeota archaeon]|nr:hypothetical protein [Candidatus Woesearchaeota archaeon]
MNTQPIAEGIYKVKSLAALYETYATSAPKDESGARAMQQEMKVAREQILRQLIELKKTVKKLQRETMPIQEEGETQ